MARLTDNNGNMLGGLSTLNHSHQTPEAAAVAAPAPPTSQTSLSQLNRRYGSEETVPDLHCSFGAFAYASAAYNLVGTLKDIETVDRNLARRLAQQRGCQNPVETLDERHHCEACGGDYCITHAEPAAHDCEHII